MYFFPANLSVNSRFYYMIEYPISSSCPELSDNYQSLSARGEQ